MKTLEFNQPKEQAAFRTGYYTIDQIHTINQVIEKCSDYNQPLYIAFNSVAFNKESIRIPIKRRIKQGDTIYLMLFTACLQEVFRSLEWEQLE